MAARMRALACAMACGLFVIAVTPAFAAPPVTTTQDAVAGSLRDAIAGASPGDTITVPAGTYVLTAGELVVDKNLTIQGSGAVTVSANNASRVFHVQGSSVTATLNDLAITGGRLAGGVQHGGGIWVEGSSNALVLNRTSVTGNTIDVNGPSNGGIVAGGAIGSDGPVTLNRSTVSDTQVSANGGSTNGGIVDGVGIYAPAGLTMTDSTVSGNRAQANGGGTNGGIIIGAGIYVGGTTTVTNSTISDNSAEASPAIGHTGGIANGGGVYSTGPTTLASVTVAGNSVSVRTGGAAGGNVYSGSTLAVRDTIVAGGTGDGGGENCAGTSITSQGHNLDSLDQCGFHAAGDIVGKDPLLGPLRDNGGPTQTRSFAATSPARDAGDPAACPPTDQRGVTRPVGPACDIGALELVYADLSVTSAVAPSSTPVGTNLTFTITVHNGGPSAAQGVALTDSLPAGVTPVSTSASTGSCSGSGACALGSLAPGASATVTVVATSTTPGAIANSATVSATTADSNPANDTATAAATVTQLTLAGLRANPSAFRLGRLLPRLSRRVPVGTTISFSLPEAASVRLSFARASAGRRVRGRCVRPNRRNTRARRCTRYLVAGALTLPAHQGLNRLRFQGRLSRRRTLKPGRYRLTAVATESHGNRSTPATVRLRILPARRR